MTDYSAPAVKIYDTTLRDGTQGEGVSFSKLDKLRICRMLDHFGVAYIEGGWPGSNPKDMAFFEAARELELTQARLAAFGSTRRAGNRVQEDPNVMALLAAKTPVVTIFGKSWLLHVTEVLRITPAANLELIGDTVGHLCESGREVVYDAEHFFDGYKANAEYAISTLQRAAAAGATTVVLCDTNGGSMPGEVSKIAALVRAALPAGVELGIHTHNDGGFALANAIAAVDMGATHVQGTINGVGERCGNVDLCSVIATLELKMGRQALPEGKVKHLTEISQCIFELANMRPDTRLPYVGKSAFAHKGGIHVNAVQKVAHSYEHITPEAVGNERRILVSELSGGSNVLLKAAEHDVDLDSKSPDVRRVLDELKRLEGEGYEFEAAGASFKLLLHKLLHNHQGFFELDGWRVIVEKRGQDAAVISEATVKVAVNGQSELCAAEGDGPVHALDTALRKALGRFFPELDEMRLADYKVRIIDGNEGTAARTRVLIESTDGKTTWSTVGVSDNILEASWQALVDSVEHVLYLRRGDAMPEADVETDEHHAVQAAMTD